MIYSYKKYKKRILRAFYKGNYNKARKIVTLHLARRKIKLLIKNERSSLSSYIETFLKTSVRIIGFSVRAFLASYSDSPKYVYEYLQKNYPGKYKFVWVIENKKTRIPYKHKKVRRFSIRYCIILPAVNTIFLIVGGRYG